MAFFIDFGGLLARLLVDFCPKLGAKIDKNQNKSDLIGDNIENSEQDFPEDVVETSKDESKIQNSEKAQAEIN